MRPRGEQHPVGDHQAASRAKYPPDLPERARTVRDVAHRLHRAGRVERLGPVRQRQRVGVLEPDAVRESLRACQRGGPDHVLGAHGNAGDLGAALARHAQSRCSGARADVQEALPGSEAQMVGDQVSHAVGGPGSVSFSRGSVHRPMCRFPP
ncbi:hypothetical protein NKH18_10620 [Streptomyces sp. M10(2022)]